MSTNNRQQKITTTLVGLGLSQRECTVLLVLLNHHGITAANLAKQLHTIPRTSIYDILKTLHQQGLISSVTRDDETYYQVEHIEHMVDVLEAQKRELTDKQNTIRSIADMFEQFKSGTIYHPGIRFFEGKQGIFAIHRELQNARTTTRTIVDIASVAHVFPHMLYEDNLKDFQTYRIPKKDLMIKTKAAEQYLKVAPLTEYHQMKWLPETMVFKTDTLIWAGHVAMIDYTDRVSAVVIDNPTMADTFVAWFEMMWESLK